MSAVRAPWLTRRPMTVRDLDAVLAIETGTYGFPWSRGNFVDSLAAGHVAELLLEAGAVIGYIVAMHGVDEMHLLNITITPAWQGQGHGSVLLAALADKARERGLARVLLEVRAGNTRARALYARHGYVEIGLRRGYYPAVQGREDAVVMRLDLQPPEGVDALV